MSSVAGDAVAGAMATSEVQVGGATEAAVVGSTSTESEMGAEAADDSGAKGCNGGAAMVAPLCRGRLGSGSKT